MNADHDTSSVPWWHQVPAVDDPIQDYPPHHEAPYAVGDSSDEATFDENESTGYATEELARLVAALREWVAIGGGTRARTTWDAATRAVGGSIRPEVVEHLQAAAVELAAALQAALSPVHHDETGRARGGEADSSTADRRAGAGDDHRNSVRRVQRIDLD